MHTFRYSQAKTVEGAVRANGTFLAGGTTLVDLMKLNVLQPAAVVDINGLPLDRIQKEADRLNELISQMLEVTRVEGDPALRKLAHVQLDELIGGLVEDCSIEARARGCSLTWTRTPAAVDGDGELRVGSPAARGDACSGTCRDKRQQEAACRKSGSDAAPGFAGRQRTDRV